MKWNIPIALLFAGTMSLSGYETLESDYRLNGTLMHAVVERALQSLKSSVPSSMTVAKKLLTASS